MRQLPSDKYNVAWFKLAEFVVRGEKERALGVYRLLVHSFDDCALAYQLEGDLLLSFNDTRAACEKYCLAAEEYKRANRFIESAAVYEHLNTLQPEHDEFLMNLLSLYQKLSMNGRISSIVKQLCELLIKKNGFDQITLLLDSYEIFLEIQQKADIYCLITLALLQKKDEPEKIITYLNSTIEFLLLSPDSQQLPTFLMNLDSHDSSYYKKALEYIKE